MNIPFKRRVIGGSVLLTSSLLIGSPVAAEDLGIIQVESTTIDDRFDHKREEPSSINVISGEEVDAAHVQNLQQVLQSVPGITTEIYPGDVLKIHIRGVENQVFMGEKPGVAVVIDGVPVFEANGRVNIDLDNIESIKVIKGGASYLFGDDALSGAVIITTKRGAKQAGYTVAGEAGAFGYYKALAKAGVAEDKYSAHAQISRREADGYHEDSAYRSDYANGKYQYYIDDVSDMTFGFENSHRKKNSHGTVTGVTAAETDPESTNVLYNDYSNHYDVRLGKYYLTYSRDVDATSNWLLNTYYFTDDTKYISSPIRGTDNYNYADDYDQTQRGIKSEYRSGGGSSAWMVAADLRLNDYSSKQVATDCTYVYTACTPGAKTQDNRTDESVSAVYGEYKFRITEPLTLSLNGRFDHIEMDYKDEFDATKNGGKNFDVWSWRLGGNYAVSDKLDYYGNISTGFRAPTPTQLFVGSKNPTSLVAANSDLTPERSYNIDLGVRMKTLLVGVPVDVDASVFQIDRKDHIQATAGQYTTDPLKESMYENIGDMRHRGLELSVRSDAQRVWSWDVAYTYMHTEYLSYDEYYLQWCAVYNLYTCAPPNRRYTLYNNTGNEVPRVPNHHLNVALRYRPASGWLVTGEMEAISSYFADEINQEKIGGHELFNLLVNYDVSHGDSGWHLFARIDNVFDKKYYLTARGYRDSNNDGIYDAEDLSITVSPGRTWTIGASAKF